MPFQCDAAKPTCSQCRRAGRKCSGYRNLDELRLVDQSTEVSSKVRKSKRKTAQPPLGYEVESSPSSSSATSEELVEVNSVVSAFPTASFWLEGNAKNIFFQQYTCGPDKSELDFANSVYRSRQTTGMLESIITALGLVALPKENRNMAMMNLASRKYLSALQQTQTALLEPRRAKSDETLATVLLLGLHELVAVDDHPSDRSRLSVHLNGAIKLLELRGDHQLTSFCNSRMYDRACTQIMYTSIMSRRPMPSAMLKVSRGLRHQMHQEEISGADLLEMSARLCLALNAVDRAATIEDHVSIFHALVALENEIVAWENSLSWRFDVSKQPIENPDKSFLRFQESYLNRLAGSSRNRYRCVRIVINEEIVRLAETHPQILDLAGADAPFTVERAKATILSMSQEICQSVPYFLGQDSCRDWREESLDPPTMFGGSAMLMPLYFAANPKRISPAMHQWLLQQVSRIGRETGLSKVGEMFADRGVVELT
ncbi:hypothetical protein M409DRAFT_54695 [Zasmidium cellare ATCC 36951]|uniref:Zn(2)-C6 fungal-type domain-containing protein n=1 Tax=Zasmidium cellare ATCC 36951 TaxID=1080233 RepID=A0A6A6CJZ4_ZASCE|nr:uncharacterized protein M409DRAFT_54695 [Zasmidium cellare ATCC 36951]KAF2166933.1 hypothetical protein M409DRAFT_54695 [Zasmidium cellare ATCC 36951]